MSSGRAAIITGASRGIGRAIALGLAGDGWGVVIAAKSTEATEKLPGTIHTVAEEVTALGGEALAVPADVRDEAQIDSLAKQTLDRFGRIDLLVNNAGGLWSSGKKSRWAVREPWDDVVDHVPHEGADAGRGPSRTASSRSQSRHSTRSMVASSSGPNSCTFDTRPPQGHLGLAKGRICDTTGQEAISLSAHRLLRYRG